MADPAHSYGNRLLEASRMKVMEVKIDGMHCGKCARRIEGGIQEVDGVKMVQANDETGIAVVEFKPGEEDERALRDQLEEMHYTVRNIEKRESV